MLKFVKKSTLFAVGVGTYIFLGRWLKKREEETTSTPPTNSTTPQAEPKAANQPVEIPLPPSAFEGLEVAETAQPSNNGASKPKAESKPKTEPTPTKETTTDSADFTQINGIGAKTAETLQGMGITTFADLAQADAATIKEQIARVSLDKIKGWIAEAKKRSMA